MFKELADAQVNAVPNVRKTSVNADSDGAAVVVGSSKVGTGYIAYVAAVVRTIRKESRGFDKARHVVMRRRREAAGKVAEAVVRREGASGGNEGTDVVIAALSFNRFLRRCEGSDVRSKVSRRGFPWVDGVSEMGAPFGDVL